MQEKQRTPRRALRLNITIRQPGDEDAGTSGLLMNVSGGGAYVATYEPLPPASRVVLEVEFPGRTLRVPGRVVHDKRRRQADEQTMFRAGMGVRFDRPSDPEAVELANLGQPLADDGGRRRYPR